VHHIEEGIAHAVPGIGGVLAWLFNTLCSAIVGLAVGALVVAVVHVLPFGRKDHGAAHTYDEEHRAARDVEHAVEQDIAQHTSEAAPRGDDLPDR
jgi:uncharacterized membrane protein YgaE (UPF0421/DUF939 family)